MTNIAEKLTAVAENQQKVYDAGKRIGNTAFWDTYQQNGSRQNYANAFAGLGWNKDIFHPRHSMMVTEGYMMFRMHNQGGTPYDLVEHLSNLGVTLDFSNSANLQHTFAMTGFSRVGVIDCSSVTGISNIFHSSSVETVDKLIVADNLRYDASFQTASKLKNITFEGSIGNNLDMHWSPLTKASIQNVLACLSPSVTEKTLILSLSAVNNAFETSDGARDGASSPAWETLIATKSNWTISLM